MARRAIRKVTYTNPSIYLHGNGLNHLAFLGNGEDLPSWKLSIFNNNGLYFEEIAVFNANWHLQLLERYENRVLSYRVITADQKRVPGGLGRKYGILSLKGFTRIWPLYLFNGEFFKYSGL